MASAATTHARLATRLRRRNARRHFQPLANLEERSQYPYLASQPSKFPSPHLTMRPSLLAVAFLTAVLAVPTLGGRGTTRLSPRQVGKSGQDLWLAMQEVGSLALELR